MAKIASMFSVKFEFFQIDEWLTCDFTFFSTVFQSYQDDERVKINGCVQLDPVYRSLFKYLVKFNL